MVTRLLVRIVMQSPLHIGGDSRSGTSAQRPLLKTRDGLPYIPATSLKGRLRAELEQLLASDQVAPRAETMVQPLSPSHPVDVISDLFGSPWLESKLHFSDLTLSDDFLPARRRPTTTTRTGVGINARRRVARDAVLYSTELFAPGVALPFEGEIMAYTDDPLEIGLLLAGLRLIERIGSSRSRGLGWCQVEVNAEPSLTPEALEEAWRWWFGGTNE